MGFKGGGVAGGGLVDLETFGDLDVDFVAGGGGRSEARERFDVGSEVAISAVEGGEIFAGGEEVVPEALNGVVSGGTPHVVVVFGEVASTIATESGDGFVGAASMDDGAVEGDVPVEIVEAERADGADDGWWILEDGGEAGDARFGDGFEDDFGILEANLRASTVGTVRDLDAVGGARVVEFAGDFFARE